MKTLQLYSPAKASLRIILLLVMVIASLGPSGTSVVYAAPLNDNFTAARLITGLTYIDSENTTTATAQGSGDSTAADPQPVGDGVTTCTGTGATVKRMMRGNNTIWYKYTTPSVSQTIAVDTIGSAHVGAPGNDIDTYLAVWTGPADGSNLSLVTCNDDNNVGQTSQLSFVGLANTTYYIQVASYNCYYPLTGCGVESGGNVVFHAYITNTTVYIANSPMGSYYIASSDRVAPLYSGISNGPVRVVNTVNTDIITSERAYREGTTLTDFNEMMGFPADQLTTEYWYPWYDATSFMQTYLVIGNASTDAVNQPSATVNVYVHGILQDSYTVPYAGQAVYFDPGMADGPVRVVSTNAVPIITSERAYRGAGLTDFNEMMGFPANQLTDEYWFPWYDATSFMQTYLVIGNASTDAVNQPSASVEVYVHGDLRASYTVPYGGRSVYFDPGVANGPVQIMSINAVPIITSERAYRGGATLTDFNEMMGFPADQLTDEYWFPWYDATGFMQTYLVIASAE